MNEFFCQFMVLWIYYLTIDVNCIRSFLVEILASSIKTNNNMRGVVERRITYKLV